MKQEPHLLRQLIAKLERSKQFRTPHEGKGVYLTKENIAGYQSEKLESAKQFHRVAEGLEELGLITLQWEIPEKVLSRVTLNPKQVDKSYQTLGQTPPWVEAQRAIESLEVELRSLESAWLVLWRDHTLSEIQGNWKTPSFVQKGDGYCSHFCKLICAYDKLSGESISQRQFSIQVFHNSKDLEKVYWEDFLKLCLKFHPELSQIPSDQPLSHQETLACLGLTPRSELVELSGEVAITYPEGVLQVGAVGGESLGISAGNCEMIQSIQFPSPCQLLFIENKTNYDLLLPHRAKDQVLIYHGGFLGGSKRKFFQTLSQWTRSDTTVLFWGDIDLGGFLMFEGLQQIFQTIKPHRMGSNEVEQFAHMGLAREQGYLEKLRGYRLEGRFPEFGTAIEEILRVGVTIEQEVML
ncbi:MAG: DUF2220 family protein [Eubacteriales bacterium]